MNCDVCGKAMSRFQPKGEPVKYLCTNEKAHPAILKAQQESAKGQKNAGPGKARPGSKGNLKRKKAK